MEHQKDANFRYAENEISKFSPSEEKCDKFSKRILGLEKFREIYFELKNAGSGWVEPVWAQNSLVGSV